MTSSARMLEFIELKGQKKSNFYKEIGLSNGYLDKVSELGSDKIASILKFYPNLNTHWLITGEGSMENVTASVLEVGSSNTQQLIPVYNHVATAGKVQLFKDFGSQQSDGYISVPHMPKCDGAVPILGDSMYPLLKSGDLVCYKLKDPTKQDFIYGEMYLVDWTDANDDDHLMAKFLARGSTKDKLKLVSHNKHHDDIEITIASIRQIALIKLSLRFNSH